ncbi:MAG: hypothetical protein O3A10_14840 [Chloroflexi bacterium]|nr:hypothetical protein [Chloroflexota bacterium]MDA1147717.1 hypothetical protein [Chloroflexota bacterium]
MTSSISRDGNTYTEAAPQLLDSLLYGVSHDLRSPLLTVSLSAQLLEHSLAGVEVAGAIEALDGLRAACDDLERMLSALNALSRAARRASDTIEVTLSSLFGGAPAVTVALDESTAGELRWAIPTGATALLDGDTAVIRWSVADAPDSPLMALAGSLHLHAGGLIERLACLQITLARHHGSLDVVGEQVTVRLPVLGGVA